MPPPAKSDYSKASLTKVAKAAASFFEKATKEAVSAFENYTVKKSQLDKTKLVSYLFDGGRGRAAKVKRACPAFLNADVSEKNSIYKAKEAAVI